MKKIFALVITCVLSLSSLYCQTIGIEAGPTLSTSTIALSAGGLGNLLNLELDGSAEVGFYAGPTLEYDFTESLGFQTGAFYSLRRVSYGLPNGTFGLGNNTKLSLNNSVIEIPIRLNAKIALPSENTDLLLFTGPSLNINLDQEYEVQVSGLQLPDILTDIIDPDNIKTTDFSWKVGVGVDFEKFRLLAQAGFGLSDISRSDIYNTTITSYSLGLNYKFTSL